MDSTVAKDRLEKLRQYRQWQPKDTSLSREVNAIATRAKQVDRTLSKLIEAWETLLPPELRTGCRPLALRAGVLDVSCDSSSAAYELTRWLQEGGRQTLSKAGPNVLRVRFCAAPMPRDAGEAQSSNASRKSQPAKLSKGKRGGKRTPRS